MRIKEISGVNNAGIEDVSCQGLFFRSVFACQEYQAVRKKKNG
jgi:hypothetical protein